MARHRMIVAATPTLGNVRAEWSMAYSNIQWPTNTVIGKIMEFDKRIAEARNAIVSKALALDDDSIEVTHIFWLDDDVLCYRDALKALYLRHLPICSGVYFTKSDAAEPLIYAGPLQGSEPFMPDRLLPVWGHGMGLTLIETSVYRRMAATCDLGRDEYGNPAWYRTISGETHIEGARENVMDITEDLYFLDLAGKLGYQPHVDTTRPAFGWHYDGAAKRGYPRPQWDERQRVGTITWDTPEGKVVWQ
jgi:hypothetical protein